MYLLSLRQINETKTTSSKMLNGCLDMLYVTSRQKENVKLIYDLTVSCSITNKCDIPRVKTVVDGLSEENRKLDLLKTAVDSKIQSTLKEAENADLRKRSSLFGLL